MVRSSDFRRVRVPRRPEIPRNPTLPPPNGPPHTRIREKSGKRGGQMRSGRIANLQILANPYRIFFDSSLIGWQNLRLVVL